MSGFMDPPGPGTFELVPIGKHPAVLRFAVDCGHHRDTYQGKPVVKHLIFIGWEMPETLRSDGTPHWKGDFFTATDFLSKSTGEPGFMFHPSSAFNKILRGWTDQPEDIVKWANFTAKLMHEQVPCFLQIDHKESKADPTKSYSYIEAVKPFKGDTPPKRVGDLVIYRIGDEGLERLPSLLVKKINASIEIVEGGYTIPSREARDGASNSSPDEDIPF